MRYDISQSFFHNKQFKMNSYDSYFHFFFFRKEIPNLGMERITEEYPNFLKL